MTPLRASLDSFRSIIWSNKTIILDIKDYSIKAPIQLCMLIVFEMLNKKHQCILFLVRILSCWVRTMLFEGKNHGELCISQANIINCIKFDIFAMLPTIIKIMYLS